MPRRWTLWILLLLQLACGGNGDFQTPVAPDNAKPTTSDPVRWTEPVVIGHPFVGPLRTLGGVLYDATGPRRALGYSDFPALRIWEDNQPEELSTLIAAQRAGYQYVRMAYTLAETETQNGGYWQGAHISPELTKRTLIPFARAARDHGIRLHIFGAYNFGSKAAELDFIRWMAGALRDDGLAETIALFEWRNEWNLTSPWGASQDSLDVAREAMRIMRDTLGCLTTVGSPGEDDTWIRRTIFDGALASIDGMRGMTGSLYMKHANGFYYRGRYQGGYAGAALWVTEPTGPNGVDGDVYIPLDDKEFLVGLYGTYSVTGQVLTFFNGPAVRHRRPIDSTWGFYELPRILANIPQDIGTWRGPTWFTKDKQFVAVLAEEWGLEKHPDFPIKTWRFIGSSGIPVEGVGPINMSPGWKAGIFTGEWQ